MNMTKHYEYLYDRPTYVYDLDLVTESVDALRKALPLGTSLYYSLKANPHPDIIKTVSELDCLVEVSSTGELASAILAGVDAGDCLYSGPGKSNRDISAAISAGVGVYSVESLQELDRLAALAAATGVCVAIILRVNPTRSTGAGGLHMTGTATQFGIDESQITRAFSLAAQYGSVELRGLHFFSMTNARTEESLILEMRNNIRAAARILAQHKFEPAMLDLGGGFAAPYAVPGQRIEYRHLRDSIEQELDVNLPWWRLKPHVLAFESGRYLVATCGDLYCQVLDVKISMGKKFVVVDAGLQCIGGVSGTGRLLPMTVRPLLPLEGRLLTNVDIVGPLCTPIDVLARAVDMPDLHPGDRVVIPNVGAYGATASLIAFLSRRPPVEVAIRAGVEVSASELEVRRVPVTPPG